MSTSDDLSVLFRAERAARPPSSAAQHGWTRLAADLAANVAPLPVAVGPLKLGLWLVPKWILAGFALGLVGGGAALPLLAPRAVLGRASRVEVHVAAANSVALAPTPTDASEHEPAPPALAEEQRVAPELTRVAPPASALSSATFDAELKLISFAKADLDAHRPTHALAWLAEHAARFPNGVFVTERDALNVLALCEQGPPDEALAQRFAVQHPSSPLVARLTKACRAATPHVGAPIPSAHASFETLPNGSGALGEPTNEPSGGEQK
jgi:hypothetical protein